MPQFSTRQFGAVEYRDDAVIEFTEGLPAFEDARRFVLIEPAEMAPVLFMQSLDRGELCFLSVPAVCLDPEYRLNVAAEELAALGFADALVTQDDMLCLSILTAREGTPPTANLMAPVVIHRRTRQARQLIQLDNRYAFEHPLGKAEGTC